VFIPISKPTILDWYNLCPSLVVAEFQKHKKMGGFGIVVQVNELIC